MFSSNNPLQELHFQVSAQEQQCGQSNITLNGQPLISQWDGPRALGAGIIRLGNDQEPLRATWQLLCLSVEGLVQKASFIDQVAENGGFIDQNAAQVLSIQFHNSQPAMKAGFSVSYQQLLRPRIVQFDPHPKSLDDIIDHSTFWITQSQDINLSKAEDDDDEFIGYVDAPQKSLHFPEMLAHLIKWELDTVKKAASKAAKACQHKFPGIHQTLHKIHKMFKAPWCREDQNPLGKNSTSGSTSPISPDEIPASSPQSHLDTTTTRPSDLPNSKHSHTTSPAATQTRSLSPSSTSTAQPSNSFAFPEASDSFQLVRPIDPSDSRLHYTKVLGIIVILACFLTWLIKRIRDPRRRADRLARQEERRNRCLYRRAARIQRVKNLIQRFRRSYRRVFRIVDMLDEKYTKVLAQEEILEDVMKDQIAAIISADGLEYDVAAAEEGRNRYIYDPGPSRQAFERRRSVATLPEYESEGTQPPGYEESRRTVDGFRYRPTIESEDTPDSSVISTSPRISRDGRDSDFEKEPEWTLDEPSIPFGGGLRQPLSEIRPTFGFRSEF